jgi:hypothetical protein
LFYILLSIELKHSLLHLYNEKENIYHTCWNIIFWKTVVTYISRFTDIVISWLFFFSFFDSSYDKKDWARCSTTSLRPKKRTITPRLNSLNIKPTRTYATGNVTHGLRQPQKSGGVKPVNVKDFNPPARLVLLITNLF